MTEPIKYQIFRAENEWVAIVDEDEPGPYQWLSGVAHHPIRALYELLVAVGGAREIQTEDAANRDLGSARGGNDSVD